MATRSPDVNITIRATDKASGVLKRIGGSFAKLGLAVAAAGAAAVVGIAALGIASVKAAISVESAFAGVAKTTDGLIDQMGGLTVVGAEIKQGFRDLAKEVPIAVEELLKIGELAGQLGVPRDAIVEFTSVIADLGATTNLTTEEAAIDLARMASIYQVGAGDMATSTEKVGSALVELGNNFETSEREILQFATRIAGAGKIAGLTQADILGIGAAMSSVGIEAAAGGTAVQTVLQEMQKAVIKGGDELKLFADVTGQTAEDFADAFRGDASQAFEAFVAGLGEQGEQAFITLDELGLADKRLSRAFLSLAGAGDKLELALIASNEAFEDGTALAEEARIRYMTTESQLKILKNTFRDIAITIGDAFLPVLNQVIQAARPFIDQVAVGIAAAVENFLVPAIDAAIELFSVGLPAALEGLAPFFEPVKIGLGELTDAFLESAPLIEEAWDDLTLHFETFISPSLQESFDNIGEGLIGLGIIWSNTDNFIIGILTIMVQTVGTLLALLLLVITSTFKTITLVITGEWSAAWDEVVETYTQFMTLFFGLFNTSWEDISGIVEGFGVNLGIIFSSIWQATLSGFEFVLREMLAAAALWALDLVGQFNDTARDVAREIDKIIKKIGEMVRTFLAVVLPKWMLGNSPGDFELAIRGISNAMGELTDLRMPALAGSLSVGGALAQAPAGPVSSSSFVIEQINVTAGEGADGRQIAQQIMDEIGERVRIATASGSGFIGG